MKKLLCLALSAILLCAAMLTVGCSANEDKTVTKMVAKEFDDIDPIIVDGVFAAKKNGKFQLYNDNGKTVSHRKYDSLQFNSKDNTYSFLSGNEFGKVESSGNEVYRLKGKYIGELYSFTDRYIRFDMSSTQKAVYDKKTKTVYNVDTLITADELTSSKDFEGFYVAKDTNEPNSYGIIKSLDGKRSLKMTASCIAYKNYILMGNYLYKKSDLITKYNISGYSKFANTCYDTWYMQTTSDNIVSYTFAGDITETVSLEANERLSIIGKSYIAVRNQNTYMYDVKQLPGLATVASYYSINRNYNTDTYTASGDSLDVTLDSNLQPIDTSTVKNSFSVMSKTFQYDASGIYDENGEKVFNAGEGDTITNAQYNELDNYFIVEYKNLTRTYLTQDYAVMHNNVLTFKVIRGKQFFTTRSEGLDTLYEGNKVIATGKRISLNQSYAVIYDKDDSDGFKDATEIHELKYGYTLSGESLESIKSELEHVEFFADKGLCVAKLQYKNVETGNPIYKLYNVKKQRLYSDREFLKVVCDLDMKMVLAESEDTIEVFKVSDSKLTQRDSLNTLSYAIAGIESRPAIRDIHFNNLIFVGDNLKFNTKHSFTLSEVQQTFGDYAILMSGGTRYAVRHVDGRLKLKFEYLAILNKNKLVLAVGNDLRVTIYDEEMNKIASKIIGVNNDIRVITTKRLKENRAYTITVGDNGKKSLIKVTYPL